MRRTDTMPRTHTLMSSLMRLSVLVASSAIVSSEPSVKEALTRLRDVGGWTPKGILDVGGHKGAWSTLAVEVYPNADFLLLEGDPELEPYLKEFGKPYEIAVVGAHSGNITCASDLSRVASLARPRLLLYCHSVFWTTGAQVAGIPKKRTSVKRRESVPHPRFLLRLSPGRLCPPTTRNDSRPDPTLSCPL